jgi:hypothetical protein
MLRQAAQNQIARIFKYATNISVVHGSKEADLGVKRFNEQYYSLYGEIKSSAQPVLQNIYYIFYIKTQKNSLKSLFNVTKPTNNI